MKICFFIDDYSATGGMQRVTSMISSALSGVYDVHVVSMYQEHGDQNDKLYNNKVHIHALMLGKKEYIKQCFKMVKLLKKYIFENGIDLIISTSEMLSPYCYLALKGTKVKYILWPHSHPTNISEAKLQKLFKKIGVKTSALTVALTEDYANQMKSIYKVNHIASISNPIDPKLLKPVSYNTDTKKIISVGRICFEKNYEKLIDVAKIVFNKNREWKWDIYGGGDIESIQKLIDANNLQDNISVCGNVDNIYDIYNKYSFQVMTSRSEGYPMTLLEGLASGLPIVAFDIPGVNNIVKQDRNGFLIEPFNEKQMAEQIDRLMNDIELRKQISLQNIEDRNKYTIEKTIDNWVRVIQEVID